MSEWVAPVVAGTLMWAMLNLADAVLGTVAAECVAVVALAGVLILLLKPQDTP